MERILDRTFLCAALGSLIFAAGAGRLCGQQQPAKSPNAPSGNVKWTSPAKWTHGIKKTSGNLSLTDSGIQFQTTAGQAFAWSFQEIQTFELSPRRLRVTGYENRRWHLHGERSFSFELESPVPPNIAAELTGRVGKPSENGVPDPNVPAFATLAARRRTRGGGTNGTLRFRKSGIDYVTDSNLGARSWRWADVETIARPDAFHFRVGGYRETFEFELKEPMSQNLFDRLWDEVYARGLNGLSLNGGVQHEDLESQGF